MARSFISLVILVFPMGLLAEENRLYQLTVFTKPQLGEVTEVYLGDRMMEKAEGAFRECVIPKRTLEKKSMLGKAVYKANEPLCKREISSKRYSASYNNHLSTEWQSFDVRWRKKGSKSSICTCNMGTCFNCVKKLSEEDVEEKSLFIRSPISKQQHIEYLGKSGDILKFTYKEFTNERADDPLRSRDTVSTEFQIDLGEENIVAFKGAVFEIIKATNATISFKVIRYFQSDLTDINY